MIVFENKNQYFKVSGYLTKPMFNRSSRNHITIIANDRVIKNNKIINAVTEGFRTYLPVGKYPIVLLKIDLDPLLIDVNIHPQKLEVKFTEERMLLSLITKTINEKLQTLSLIPKVKEEEKVEQNYKYEKLNLKDKTDNKPNLVKEDFENYINNMVDKKIKQDILDSYKTQEEILEIKKLPELEYIGQLLGTYLIFQNEEGMYIMDQHAAAERVRYENYYKTKKADHNRSAFSIKTATLFSYRLYFFLCLQRPLHQLSLRFYLLKCQKGHFYCEVLLLNRHQD